MDLLRLITLQDANTRVVLLGASLLGIVCGVIGAFAVLRRRSLVSDAVAHSALPGIAVAYFVVGDRHFAAFLAGALAFGVLGVLAIAFIRAHTRVKEDAAIGIVLASFFGLGIVLSRIIQNQPSGNRAGLDGFLFGKAASMVRQDVYLIGAVAVAVLATTAALFKELRLVCFDRDFAAAQGWPVFFLDLLLMTLICLCTVVGLPAVGVVLVVALLIIPAVAARFWTDSLTRVVLLSGAFGLVAGSVGAALSATLPGPPGSLSRGQPAGPVITITAATLCLVSLVAAPRRGLIAAALRRYGLRRRISAQNLLRALFELGEGGAQSLARWRRADLLPLRSWSHRELDRAIRRAARRGLVAADRDTVALTDAGAREAAHIARSHRLWELFLIEGADIAPDHVDRDADLVEHLLPAELLDRLEERLRTRGRLPGEFPASPHRIGEAAP